MGRLFDRCVAAPNLPEYARRRANGTLNDAQSSGSSSACQAVKIQVFGRRSLHRNAGHDKSVADKRYKCRAAITAALAVYDKGVSCYLCMRSDAAKAVAAKLQEDSDVRTRMMRYEYRKGRWKSSLCQCYKSEVRPKIKPLFNAGTRLFRQECPIDNISNVNSCTILVWQILYCVHLIHTE